MTQQQTLAGLAASLATEADAISALVVRRLRTEVPELWPAAEPEWERVLHRSVRDHVETIVHELGRIRRLPTQLPPSALDEAQTAARLRIPIDAVLRGRRVAHAAIWESLMEEVQRSQIPTGPAIEAMRSASRFMFAFVDALLPQLAAAYEQERQTRAIGNAQRRERLLREVLAGLHVDDADLRYPLSGWHVCVIAWGPDADTTLARISAALDARDQVHLAGDAGGVCAWLQPATGAALDAADLPGELVYAIGEAASGADGFRLTHRQAQQAQAVALRRTSAPRATRYRDVALEALAVADADAARDFVAFWIGPLTVDDDRTALLRETLATYLELGGSTLAAAADLGVSGRTVTYRLRAIEERLLGAPIAARRDELAVALRLHRLIEPSAAAAPAAGRP